ncbi:MAG: phosphoribosylformylglycinamidine synthase subunit PurL [Chloroflexi bacterium]|nr:phosphoribosylformylglycinamidine synthase subunit PurL [Chloroflexota bacterium]MBI3339469.1 phosphoribosylformylglycinamidine synthase subunit PurL [Chloroflexota bacterium]
MSIYRFVVHFTNFDPRSARYLSDAHALGFHNLQRIKCQDLYFIEGQLSQKELQQLALKLLTDPVTQSASWAELPAPPSALEPGTAIVEVSLRPGVTDPVAHEIIRAAHELGFGGVRRAATGQRFLLTLDNESASTFIDSANKLAAQLLANPVIHCWVVGEIAPSFLQEMESSGAVEIISICNLTDEELLALSKDRRAALDLAEMKAIQSYCVKENRELTDAEFETIAQTWSEHCGHKTFKAKIELNDGREINSILKTYLKSATDEINAPWVLSAFVDNAGIIDLDGENEVSFKVETHNHPSAIEPFGGANTGVGGVIRDVLGVSHKPIANTDILCFGPQNVTFDQLPQGVLHPRRVMSGVVAGVQDYGNKIGIPTVNGAILFDEGYTANPLVFCGCVGIAPKGLHVRSPQKGDRVIVLGGQTGRDGLRGATFSSMTMDAQTGEVAGASVQIGDPITEKGLIDVIVRARDLKLYHAITDCGAGGFSSAIGEMSSAIGADIELQNVHLKYAGLAPWEIWLSEAQERMVLAVAPEHVAALQELCDTYDTQLTDVGEFTGTHRLVVRYAGKVVVDLENDFLHDGIPQRQLKAVIRDRVIDNQEDPLISNYQLPNILLQLLSHPNIASKASVIRIYDHEVQGGTVIKPLTGVEADAPSDASVIHPLGAKGLAGVAIANGVNPEYGKRDAYRMAFAVVDEAVRNLVAVGADPERIAILDNFCWGDPLCPETLGSLVEAARGCHDAALLYRTPFISGKDSLNNEYMGADGQRHAIPPTLLISSIGVMQDITEAVTMDLKEAGNELYLVGKFAPTFGGSHFSLVTSQHKNESVPDVNRITPQVYKALHQAIKAKLIRSSHDLSEGGLAVAAAEMCIGGRLGIDLTLDRVPLQTPLSLFGETTGCLLVEIAPANIAAFELIFKDLPLIKIGQVTSDSILKFGDDAILVGSLANAFNPSS